MTWKKGSGKLGVFQPLLGVWQAQTESERGPVTCRREFRQVLEDKYIQLTAVWEIPGSTYQEIALIGVNPEKEITFWSFTSDGKQSRGQLTDVSEIHPQAIGFAAQMPAGLARNIYWPDSENGFYWAVESHTKKGWNRFVEHHYLPAGSS